MTSHPHSRLRAYQFALSFHRQVCVLIDELPAGVVHLTDQLRRASRSVCLNLAEGASSWSRPNKLKYFQIALASAGECGAALDLIEIEQGQKIRNLEPIRSDLEACAALTVGLIRRR